MGLSPMSSSSYEKEHPPIGRIVFEMPPEVSLESRRVFEQRLREDAKRRGVVTSPFRTPIEVSVGENVTVLVPKGQPNPRRFQVQRTELVGSGLIASVVYPDATTFEGRKILVFDRVRPEALRALEVLDPHFARPEDVPGGAVVPVARFEPTERGWRLARVCAAAL